MATSAKSHGFADSRAAVSNASNCKCVNPRVGDSAGTEGRRTCSAGECGKTPSRTLIAAVAEREYVTVVHYDVDYELIAQVTRQPVQWVVPRGTVP
jgi:hypothetical protein